MPAKTRAHTLLTVAILSMLAHLVAPLSAQTAPPPVSKARVVEAGTVVGDFARDYPAAMDKYLVDDIALEGRVDRVNIRKGTDGNTYVTVNLLPRDLGSKTMIPIYVDFSNKMADQVSKLKQGDLVQIEVTYSPIPAAAPIIHEVRGFMGDKLTVLGKDPKIAKLREDLVTWVKKNNTLKPLPSGADNELVKDMSQKIDGSLEHGDDFSILFGAGLMRSGKPTALCVQDGKMITLELTAAQATAKGLESMMAVHMTTASTALRMPPEVQMTAPVIEGNGAWDLSKPLAGKVAIKDLTRHDNVPGEYGVRMVCYAGDIRTVFYSSFHGQVGTATFPLRFAALNWEIEALKVAKQPGPYIVFFEVVRRIGPDRFTPEKAEPTYEVISEPAAMVLNLSAGK